MRSILVDWLVDVTMKFEMVPQTLFMTIDVLDRYLSKKQIARKKLQLVGLAALLIVGKFEEIYPPLLKDYIKVCDNAFTKKEILSMEADILMELSFDICHASSLTILEHLQESIQLKEKPYFFAKYLLETSLVDSRCLKYRNMELVVGSLFLVKKLYKLGGWERSWESISGVKEIKAKICAKDLYLSMKKMT